MDGSRWDGFLRVTCWSWCSWMLRFWPCSLPCYIYILSFWWFSFHIYICFSTRFFFQTLTIHRTAGKGRGPSFIPLYHITYLWTFRHLFATLHLRWLLHIFNCTSHILQIATLWDLPPYWITIWLINDAILISVYLAISIYADDIIYTDDAIYALSVISLLNSFLNS